MKRKSPGRRPTPVLLAVAFVCIVSSIAYPYAAIQNKADHIEICVVPAPGKVVVDGDLSDWDMSGSILMFIDEASKDSYNVRAAMMYDKDYVYVGGHWKDPTPMMNMTHFGGDVQNQLLSMPSLLRGLGQSPSRAQGPIHSDGYHNRCGLRCVREIRYCTVFGKEPRCDTAVYSRCLPPSCCWRHQYVLTL